MLDMAKLQENKSQFFIAVPKLYVKVKKWKKGQILLWTINKDGNLELREL
jgi:hypothetical protein